MKPKKFSLKQTIRLFLTGSAMGLADIVPGVSGGTVAFLLGIYEELIYSIKLISGEVLRLLVKLKFKEAFQKIPFTFLVPLGVGLMGAVLTFSHTIAELLKTHPDYLWSFFFGLVLASVWVVRKRVKTWDWHDYLALVALSIFTYILVGAVPVETPRSYLAFFISGFIAICAMILPGISGSFLLVIMGKYEQILTALNQRDLPVILVFIAGCIIGLALFARVLSYLFAKHHDILIAGLMGFMIGSMRKVWPWKEILMTRVDSHGEIVPVVEKNIFPNLDSPVTYLCIGLGIAGFLLVTILDKLQTTKEHSDDINDPSFVKAHKSSITSQKKGKI